VACGQISGVFVLSQVNGLRLPVAIEINAVVQLLFYDFAGRRLPYTHCPAD